MGAVSSEGTHDPSPEQAWRVVSAAAAEAAGLDTAGLESRALALRGRDESLTVWVGSG